MDLVPKIARDDRLMLAWIARPLVDGIPAVYEAEGCRIREQIALWAEAAKAEIKWADLAVQITDRDADVWEAPIAIADVIGGHWPSRARAAAIALVGESKEIEPSLGIRLLQDLRSAFGTADYMPSKSIVQVLHGMDEAPWSDLKGKPLDERGLAHRLRQYGVKPKTIRLGDTTAKGYLRADLQDAWKRYLPSAPNVTTVTSVTPATSMGQLPPGDRIRANQSGNGLTALTDVTDVTLLQGGIGLGGETAL